MLDAFKQVRKEHHLTESEIVLLTDIGSVQNPEFEEAFKEIQTNVSKLRTLTNDIDSPQKSSEERKLTAMAKKADTTRSQLEKVKAQFEKLNEVLVSTQEKMQEVSNKMVELETELSSLEEQKSKIGPDRLTYITEEYFQTLFNLVEFSSSIDSVLQADNKDIVNILPFLKPYMEELTDLGELVE